jgi:hypothetical protein
MVGAPATTLDDIPDGGFIMEEGRTKAKFLKFCGKDQSPDPKPDVTPNVDLYSFIEHTILHEVAMTVDKRHASC